MTSERRATADIGYCSQCGVVVSRYHADNPGLFHTHTHPKETSNGHIN